MALNFLEEMPLDLTTKSNYDLSHLNKCEQNILVQLSIKLLLLRYGREFGIELLGDKYLFDSCNWLYDACYKGVGTSWYKTYFRDLFPESVSVTRFSSQDCQRLYEDIGRELVEYHLLDQYMSYPFFSETIACAEYYDLSVINKDCSGDCESCSKFHNFCERERDSGIEDGELIEVEECDTATCIAAEISAVCIRKERSFASNTIGTIAEALYDISRDEFFTPEFFEFSEDFQMDIMVAAASTFSDTSVTDDDGNSVISHMHCLVHPYGQRVLNVLKQFMDGERLSGFTQDDSRYMSSIGRVVFRCLDTISNYREVYTSYNGHYLTNVVRNDSAFGIIVSFQEEMQYSELTVAVTLFQKLIDAVYYKIVEVDKSLLGMNDSNS